jgi:hypothetical protein
MNIENGIEMIAAADAPAIESLDARYMRAMNPKGNCPGFRVFAALGDNGVWYLIDGDNNGGAETRLYFRSRGVGGSGDAGPDREAGAVSKIVKCADLGENPDVRAWDAAKAEQAAAARAKRAAKR